VKTPSILASRLFLLV